MFLQGFSDNAPAGCQFTFTSITPGGQQLYTHSTTASTLATINAGNYDHVVIQEQSLTHSLAHRVLEVNMPSTDAQNFFEGYQNVYAPGGTSNNSTTTATAYWGMKNIIEAIQAGGNPDAQIHLYQTWGRHVSAASDLSWNAGTDAQKVARHLEQNILMARDAAAHFDPTAKIARVGEAFQLSLVTNPSIPIYATDGSHGNNVGRYLGAAILYQQITGLRAIDNLYHSTLAGYSVGYAREAHCRNIADSFYEEASFELTDFQRNNVNNEITLTWSCGPCTEYYIEFSPNLQTWTEVAGTRATTAANILSTNKTFADSGTKKFFRIARP